MAALAIKEGHISITQAHVLLTSLLLKKQQAVELHRRLDLKVSRLNPGLCPVANVCAQCGIVISVAHLHLSNLQCYDSAQQSSLI